VATSVDVLIASTAQVRDAVFRFRESIAGHGPVDILPAERREGAGLQDTLDPLAVIFAAITPDSGRLVGAVRSNLLRDGSIPLYPQLYELGGLSPTGWHASAVTSAWALEPPAAICDDAVRSRIATDLAWAQFNFLLRERICFDFLDCPDQHVGFFERLGYRHQRSIVHPRRGVTNLMRLDTYDWTHLAAVKSPFLTLARG
jgi:hypothetical protein